jgi:BirA family biotin operon repressor/biotin-[acetyl-CoA-carboxylase] ligase
VESIPLRNPFPGAVSFLLASTDSTQKDARRLAEAASLGGDPPAPGGGFPVGSLVAAETQTAGRGRIPERRWESEAGKNLLFTVFLGPGPASLPGLPLRIGTALCGAVALYADKAGARFDRPPRLKWPNDLMLGDRKAAGILCESGPSGVFAGIGLNCNQVEFPPWLDAKATSLAAELGREVSRWDLLELFLGALAESLRDVEWRGKAEGMLWKKGERATFLPGSASPGPAAGRRVLMGRPVGLDGEGSLLFLEDGAESAVAHASGELRAGETS